MGLRGRNGASIASVVNGFADAIRNDTYSFDDGWIHGGSIAYYFVTHTNLSEICSGITYTGQNDGRCLVIYDWNNIYPVAWCRKSEAEMQLRDAERADSSIYRPMEYGEWGYGDVPETKRKRPFVKYMTNNNADHEEFAVHGEEKEFNRRYFEQLDPARRAVYGAASAIAYNYGADEHKRIDPNGLYRTVRRNLRGLGSDELMRVANGSLRFSKDIQNNCNENFPTSGRAINRKFPSSRELLRSWTPDMSYDEGDSTEANVRTFAIYALLAIDSVEAAIANERDDTDAWKRAEAYGMVAALDILVSRGIKAGTIRDADPEITPGLLRKIWRRVAECRNAASKHLCGLAEGMVDVALSKIEEIARSLASLLPESA